MKNQLADSDSAFYQHTKSIPLASRVSYRVRTKMFQRFIKEFSPSRELRVLDVGVTSDAVQAESNYFEKMYPFPEQITCIGTEDGSHLMEEYPGLHYEQVSPGQPLPFEDRVFDIVFSNAVLEHVGNRKEQAAFLREIVRVGKVFFVTTPNRWFPIEHHTGLPLLHFLPPSIYRAIVNRTKYRYWAQEAHLNILTRSEFSSLFDPDVRVRMESVSVAGLPSNLIAIGST